VASTWLASSDAVLRGSAVASDRRCAYGLVMMVGTPTHWFTRVVRLVMLVLGVVATPSVGMEAMRRPHCARHELAAQHAGHAAASSTTAQGPDTQAWMPRHDHGCAHCPASECARVSPCTGSSSTAVAPSRAVVESLDSHRVAVYPARHQVHSASSPPDTPPPQLIA
jgi:hypothetical protein